MLDLSELDDPHLAALSRALHEARFCEAEADSLVWASPLVVDLHEWVLAEQRRRDIATGRRVDWNWFLQWAGRSEQQRVIDRLRRDPQKLAFVERDPEELRRALRPFVVEDQDLRVMIESARLSTDQT